MEVIEENESVNSSRDTGKAREGSNADVDGKVARILELIKREGQSKKRGAKGWKWESELVGLVEDLHKQFRSLYVSSPQPKPEKVRGERVGRRRTSSGSDNSEYFSSDEVEDQISELNAAIVDEELIKLKDLLDSATKEREALSSEHTEALRKIQEADSLIEDLRAEADAREQEVISLSEKNRLSEAQALSRQKELEDELIGLRSELESLQPKKTNIEGQLEGEATTANELQEENRSLQSRVSELELILNNKQKESSDLLKNLQDTENNGSCKVAELTARVHELQLELDLLRAQKHETDDKMESLRNEQVVREQEFNGKMESLENELAAREKELDEKVESLGNERKAQQKELEDVQRDLQALVSELEGKKNEVSENLLEINSLKEELARREEGAQRLLDENTSLGQQVEDLKLKVNSLTEHGHELEEKLRAKSDESDHLREEKEGVEAKVTELRRKLTERRDEVTSLQDRLRAEVDANSAQITGFRIEIESLRQEFDSLEAQKSRLEQNNKREEEETSRRMSLLENENAQLTSMVQDLQSKINEHARPAGRVIGMNNKHTKNSPRNSNASNIERKIEDLADEYRMNLEDNIRILCRRILVLEQLHMETKESYKSSKDRFHDEYKDLGEKISFYKNEMKKIMEASVTANTMMTELDLLVRQSDESSRSILNRVSQVSREVQLMKDWVLLEKQQRDCRSVQEEDTKVRDSERLEEVKKLENKVEELEGVVRDRDNVLLVLGEEKREAIRQLCVQIDYQRSRCDYFKEIIAKVTVKRKK